MATQTLLTAGSNDSNLSSYNTASVSPGANKLITLAVLSRATSGDAEIPTVSGCNLDWVQVATIIDGNRITIFRAMDAAPTSGAITISFFGSQTQMYCHWKVNEWGSVDTGGTDGSAAVVQSATAKDTATNTGLTVNLAAFGSPTNAVYGIVRAGDTITPGSGFTEISESSGEAIFQDQWKNSSDTSVDWSWPSNGSFALGIAIEIKTLTSTTFTRSLPVTSTAVISLARLRTAYRSLTQTAAAVLALSRARTTLRSISTTALAALTLTKGLVSLRSLTLSAAAVPALSYANIVVRALSATAATTVTLVRAATHYLSLAVGGATSTTPASPGTVSDDSAVGTVAWSNPGNAAASDNAYATFAGPGTSHYLKATDFGFNIPSDATIDGIIVETERSRTSFSTNPTTTARLRIVKGGSISSTEITDSYAWTTTDTYVVSGSSSELWGETWTPADINASDFGAAFYTSLSIARMLQIDHIRITVHYTLPNGIQAIASLSKGLLKVANLAVTVAAVLALSQVRTYLRTFSLSATASVLLSSISTFARSLTHTATAIVSLTPAATFYRTLTVTASAVLDLAQQFISGIVSIGLSVTASANVTFARLIHLSKSVTATASVALTRTQFRVLTTTATATLAILKTVQKTLSTIASATATLSKGLLYTRTLASSATAAISIVRSRTVVKTLAQNAAASVTFTKGLLYVAVLTVSAAAVASLSRLATHAISLTVSPLARLQLYVNGLAARYSRKYPAQGSSYSTKYPAQGTDYDSKYPARGTSYEEKYPS